MSSATLTPSFGSLFPPTHHLSPPSSSALPCSLALPIHAPGSLPIDLPNHDYSPSPAASSSSPTPSSSALNSRTTSATSTSSAGGQLKSLGIRKRISGSFDIPKKLKERIPDIGELCAMMGGLPVIREAVEGVQAVQDMTTSRQKLLVFGQRLESLLSIIEANKQDPRYLNPTFLAFAKHLENTYALVQKETRRQSGSRIDSASRLLDLIDEYEGKFASLVEEAMATGVFAQQNVPLPEVYDSTIPTLKSIHKDNGLVCVETLRTSRPDGSAPKEDLMSDLHVSTIRGEYNGTPVEIQEFFGGPEEKLTERVKELVGHYQMHGLNPNLPDLYGGSFVRSSTGQLRAQLVFSPAEGEPWMVLARAKKSVELLCQLAEQTSQAFKYLKLQKQMNWESIRIRPDGTLLLLPSTEGDNFLMEEEVLDPFHIPRDDIGWPFRELCELLHEASQQGLLTDAIQALREHDGAWDNIAVWRVAAMIGLRVPEDSRPFRTYPSMSWQTHPGLIVRWAPVMTSEEYRTQCYEPVARMPAAGLAPHEQERLKSFCVITAFATVPGNFMSYMKPRGEHWLTPTEDGLWETIALEPWENVTSIRLAYESPRLEHVSWKDWKPILKSAAKKKKLDADELAVVIRTEGVLVIRKENVPELGTRPIYFYRKPDPTAPPHEFWGFFTFNKDPTGPTGLTVRLTEPEQYGCIFSENATPEMLAKPQTRIGLDFAVVFANMMDDWSCMVEIEKERLRCLEIDKDSESEVEWPEDEI